MYFSTSLIAVGSNLLHSMVKVIILLKNKKNTIMSLLNKHVSLYYSWTLLFTKSAGLGNWCGCIQSRKSVEEACDNLLKI